VLRTVFMGTPEFAATILELLLQAGRAPLAVVTQPARAAGRGQKAQASAVEQLALSKGLRVFSTENVNAPEMIASLSELSPDLFLVAAFGQILKKDILGLPNLFSLNVHGSLLPKLRGAAPIQRAILEGFSDTGITIQKMVRKLDAGDIVYQQSTRIGENETATELFHRLAPLGGQCLIESLRLIESDEFTLTPQVESEATLAPKLSKEDAVISWENEADAIHRQIRGLQPWPIAESRLGGQRLKIFRAEKAEPKMPLAPGALWTDHRTELHVGCANHQALALTQIQLENRKKLEIRDFLMAYRGTFPLSHMG
jgi:methionyl-tRNA formyltransferase